MSDQLQEYLRSPLLNRLYTEIRKAGPIRPISLDITNVCNIRCQGCWFFAQDLDTHESPREEAVFDAFIAAEKARGTNFVTVTGGEPSLQLERIKKVYDNFWLVVVTNGLRKIPYEGLENLPIAVSIWGDHTTDTFLRGGNKLDIFSRALTHYRDDPRAMWYYTTTPGKVNEIERVVEQCIANGNRVMFNFYGDVSQIGGAFDHRQGFAAVRAEIDRMITRYPDRIMLTNYMAEVFSSGQLYEQRWGYDTCCVLTYDNPINTARLENGNLYSPHFRAYNADLHSTRRCCSGDEQDCNTCFNSWMQMSWIMLNVERHMGSQPEFTNWLTSTYIFYLANRIVNFNTGIKLLPQIHKLVGHRPAQEPTPRVA